MCLGFGLAETRLRAVVVVVADEEVNPPMTSIELICAMYVQIKLLHRTWHLAQILENQNKQRAPHSKDFDLVLDTPCAILTKRSENLSIMFHDDCVARESAMTNYKGSILSVFKVLLKCCSAAPPTAR